MSEHAFYLVYQHLEAFFRSRGLTPDQGLDIDRDALVRELLDPRFHRITAWLEAGASPAGPGGASSSSSGSAREYTVVLLIETRTKEGSDKLKTAQLRPLLERFATDPERTIAEVIVIVRDAGLAGGADVLANFRRKLPATRFSIHPCYMFFTDLPRAGAVPRHRVVPADEVAGRLALQRLGLENLRTIQETDPPLVWIGARVGDVVEIDSPSDVTLSEYDLCLVVPDRD